MPLPENELINYKMAPAELRATRRNEWDEVNMRLQMAAEIGFEAYQHTALVEEKPWSQSDVETTRDYLIKIAPVTSSRIYPGPGFSQHLLLASIYHRKLAERIASPDISPHEAEVMGLLHDVGRIIDPDYFANDKVTEILLRRLGAKEEFVDKFYPIGRILGRKPSVEKLSDLTVPQRIDDVGDNMAKLKDGEMFTVQHMVAYCESTAGGRYQYGPHDRPTKRWGLKAMENGRAQIAAQIVLDEIGWMENEFGINFEQMGQEVYQEFLEPVNQEWIQRFESARPSR